MEGRWSWIVTVVLLTLVGPAAAQGPDDEPVFSFVVQDSEFSTVAPLEPGQKATFKVPIDRACPATVGIVLEDQSVLVSVGSPALVTQAPATLEFPRLVCRFEDHQSVLLEINVTAGPPR